MHQMLDNNSGEVFWLVVVVWCGGIDNCTRYTVSDTVNSGVVVVK